MHRDDDNDALKAEADYASAMLETHNRVKAERDADDGPAHGRPPTLRGFIMKNFIYILGVVVVACLVGLGIVVAAPFIAGDRDGALDGETYVSPYDWTQLRHEGDRFAYVVDGQIRSRFGIDVSENQHAIDWNAVAADGVEFAMIRLGYRGATAGDLYLDEQYWANMDGARNVGIDVGVYFFSQANTPEEAIEEAEYVLTYLNGIPLEYPVAFDSEERVLGISKSRTSGLDNAQMTAIAKAFCDRIAEAGYDTIVYGNAADLARYRRSYLENEKIWWAEYGIVAPTAKVDMTVWQYSNTGRVAGIQNEVDLNLDLSHALDEPEPAS